jgi:4-amino-4-deoxy-L-arabinose transferase-like glycosyltransferase
LTAHAGVASTDFPVAAMLFVACYRTYRWAEDPTVKNGCLCALTVSLAAMTKYSVLVFLPPIALLYWAGMSRKRSKEDAAPAFRWRGSVQRGALYLAVAFAAAWACYSFSARTISDPSHRPVEIVDRFVTPGSLLSRGLYWFEENVPVPFIDTVNGLRTLNRHNRGGHEAFLLGEVRKKGWWYYFPVVILVKTTLPLLALMLVAAVLAAVERNGRDGRLYALGAIVVIVGVSMTSSINIGVRHILSAYPFMAMLAASMFHGMDASKIFRPWLPRVAAALVVWHVAEGISGMPDNISYFQPDCPRPGTQGARGQQTGLGPGSCRTPQIRRKQRHPIVLLSVLRQRRSARFWSSPSDPGQARR